jgi:cell fate regulator YaaT (PSP1 superfamily)
MSEQITENKDNQSEIKESRFQEGELLRFVRVRFPGHTKSYPFHIGKRDIHYGQKVVAMSDRGMAVGYVNSFPYELSFQKDMLPVKSINKVATEEDIKKQREDFYKEKEFEVICLDLIEKHNLDMNLTHVEFTQFGKKVVFYFTAPARVDFRGLVKDLVSTLKLRIELRQISVRDRAAAVGSIGPCGRQLCCSTFLSRYGSVNIKMAKNQNLTLTYGKLNGVCGQLKCCLTYEDDVYEAKRKKLPREGHFVELKNGDRGRVERLHILSEQFDVLTDRGLVRRYTQDQYIKRCNENYRFPRQFEHISSETSQVIGLTQSESDKTREFERQMNELKEDGKVKAHTIFEDLFGVETFLDPQEYQKIKEQKVKAKEEQKALEQEQIQKHKELMQAEQPSQEENKVDRPKDNERQDRSGNRNRNRNKNRNRNRNRNRKRD